MSWQRRGLVLLLSVASLLLLECSQRFAGAGFIRSVDEKHKTTFGHSTEQHTFCQT